MKQQTLLRAGFTIVELLIVIVIIGILAAITIVAYNGVQSKAQKAKMTSDISQISRAITIARESTQKSTLQITGNRIHGSGGVAAACNSNPSGTDLATLPKSSSCWTAYTKFLDTISTASGLMIRDIVDPWGRPYAISEREENGGCTQDAIWAFTNPYTGWGGRVPGTEVTLPFSGYTSC